MSMPAAAKAAVDAAYSHLSEAATYEPRDAAPMPVSVVHGVEPAPSVGARTSARQTDTTLRVRVSEVDDPKQGDKVTLADGKCLEVQDSFALNRWEWGLIVR